MFDIPLYYLVIRSGQVFVDSTSLGSITEWLWYIMHVDLSSYPTGTVKIVHTILIWWAMVILSLVAERVLLMQAVRKDVRGRFPQHQLLWTILTAAFGLLSVAGYAVVSHTVYARKVVCADCGAVSYHTQKFEKVSGMWQVAFLLVLLLFIFAYNYANSLSTMRSA
ncbi:MULTISPECIES: hypothetical protein [Caproicibacterium]|uniref:Uncharacterized protein n=1 Tax=Caproicibacterium argilliputei TaxID=3030016 RepID=A0AA97DAF5_9FIRM|nr:hypothetical protein [Caproicibacterium argilliputei]WOC32264.1 hypothetical protein PXC00_13940 [Caproicibacterium argilliputei]